MGVWENEEYSRRELVNVTIGIIRVIALFYVMISNETHGKTTDYVT